MQAPTIIHMPTTKQLMAAINHEISIINPAKDSMSFRQQNHPYTHENAAVKENEMSQ
jgi:hypothetical protein